MLNWQIDIQNLDFIDEKIKLVLKVKENNFGAGVITSLYRIGDKGVHGTLPLRAIDERCQDDKLGKEIEEYINNLFFYDPDRPEMKVCMYHDVGRGKHLHYQVHPKTRIK